MSIKEATMPIAGIYGPDDFGNPARRRASTPTRSRVSAAERARALPMPSLQWTPEVERATAHLYERVKNVISPVEWPFMAPYVKAINELKQVRGAVILAHNYQTPEIFHCVADIGGDSLQLAIEATKVKSDIIVQCGVPVVAYVNTSAEVKAEVDICCTSSNAVQVVESLNAPTVIFLPDQYLANYVASNTKVKIIAWKGACEVHERFTGDELRAYREADPSVQIIAHPECPPDVLAEADFTGSTAHMINWVRNTHPKRVVMITECSMADNVKAELPDVEMVRPCNLCPHMKRITLPKILDSLIYLREEVTIDPVIAEKARRSVERMI